MTPFFTIFLLCFVIHGSSARHETSGSWFLLMAPFDLSAIMKALNETEGQCPKCQNPEELTKTQNCLKEFGGSARFRNQAYPGYPPLKVSDAIYSIMRTFFSRSSGLSALCKAQSALEQCIGEQFAECINFKGFIRMGVTIEDAWYYSQMFGQLQFLCLAQQDQNSTCYEVAPGFSCIKKVMSSMKKSIEIHGDATSSCHQQNSPWQNCLQLSVSRLDNDVTESCGMNEGKLACYALKAGINHLLGNGFGIQAQAGTYCTSDLREKLVSTEFCPN